MRRTLIMTLASTMLLAVAPGAALARHHHGRHHHARVERFGSRDQSTTSSGSQSAENAGTVQSFANDVLTLKLNDGSTVSGRVNNGTEFECRAAASQSMSRDDGSGDSSGDGDHNSGGEDNQTAGQNQTAGENDTAENENDANENDGNENQNQAGMCDSSALTPGTVVREAELRLSSDGASWKKLELITS